MQKKIALLHRYAKYRIKETDAAFPYLEAKGIDVLTFKTFNRLNSWSKFAKSLLWIFYAPLLVIGKKYDVIYCDDSFPFYPALVKFVSRKSKLVLRLGDLHLRYYTSGWLYKFLHCFEKISWLMADKIIVISETMADYVRAEVKDSTPIKVILDPVEALDFPIEDQAPRPIVMFHGLLTKNKGIDILLKAAAKMPHVKFSIVGDGPDMKRLMKLAPSNVNFQGWVPFKDIKNHINLCAVGVALRSHNPGNDYVVTSPFLQYGVCGKPCLVTRRKVFGDYPWQFSDTNEMVDKLKILLREPWKEGAKLRSFVLKYHNAEKIAEDIWTILSQP